MREDTSSILVLVRTFSGRNVLSILLVHCKHVLVAVDGLGLGNMEEGGVAAGGCWWQRDAGADADASWWAHISGGWYGVRVRHGTSYSYAKQLGLGWLVGPVRMNWQRQEGKRRRTNARGVRVSGGKMLQAVCPWHRELMMPSSRMLDARGRSARGHEGTSRRGGASEPFGSCPAVYGWWLAGVSGSARAHRVPKLHTCETGYANGANHWERQ